MKIEISIISYIIEMRLVATEPIIVIPKGLSRNGKIGPRRNYWSDDDEEPRVRAAPAEPADESDETDSSDDEYIAPDLSTMEARTAFFWSRIGLCDWGQNTRIPSAFFGKTAEEIAALTEVYTRLYQSTWDIFNEDKLFDRYKMSDTDRAKVISHCIALGRDAYENLMTEMHLVDYLWSSGECHSFDSKLGPMSMLAPVRMK